MTRQFEKRIRAIRARIDSREPIKTTLNYETALLSPSNPVLGLGSGGRLLRHFQTPDLYWINFSLRHVQPQFAPMQRLCTSLPQYHCKPPVAIMAPNFPKLVLKFWKLVSKRKYALTSRKYSLTPRKYALTPRKDFKRTLPREC